MKRFYFYAEVVQQGKPKVVIKYKLGEEYISVSFLREDQTAENLALIGEYITNGLDVTVLEEIKANARGTQI